jgi:hypothetical protein
MGVNINLGKNFITNAVAAAGKAVGSAVKSIGDATGKVGGALKKIPVVGPLLHGVWGVMGTPFDLTDRIIKGERLDRALIEQFKNYVQSVREIVPYAQTIISFIPGVGTTVSAAIGAASAIVSGQPISDVVMEAVKGALPGGEIAGAAFDAAGAVISGKDIGAVAVAALPLPEETKPLIGGALKLAASVASGKPPGDAVIQATMAALPPDVQSTLKHVGADKLTGALADAAFHAATQKGLEPEQAKALQAGIAMSLARRLQTVTVKASQHPHTLAELSKDGQAVTSHTPVAKAARAMLHGRGTNGFDIGLGLMQYAGLNPYAVLATREVLSPADQHGFNTALALHIGRVRAPAPPTKDVGHHLGYFVTKGMQGAAETTKQNLMRMLAANAAARAGAERAVEQIHQARGLAATPILPPTDPERMT